jgi:cytochrome c oxidase assembly factor CtaG
VDVILLLALAGALYTRGWRRLWQRTHHTQQRGESRSQRAFSKNRPLAVRWRLAAYLAGLFVIGLALLSPIDVLGSQLFLMHMVQHLLLIMIAPPLLLIANPMAVILWGLPTRARHRVGRVMSHLLHRKSSFRHALRSLTAPGVIWLFSVISIIGWHDPVAYNGALRNRYIHDLEHINFFLVGMLFWWKVTGAGPRIYKQFPLIGRIAFVIAAIPPNMFTGVVIAFATEPLYSYYTTVPRLWGISVMTDQQVSGIIMWIPGSMMYIIAALLLAAQLLQGEARKPALPESAWATEEALIAPGIKK